MIRWQSIKLYLVLATSSAALACGQGVTPSAGPTHEASPRSTPSPSTPVAAATRSDLDPGKSFGNVWKTDFSKHLVPLKEIRYLGIARVPINPADAPTHETIQEASRRLSDLEPVIVVEVNGQVRAYPESMLIFVATEVANDTLGGVPIAVTW